MGYLSRVVHPPIVRVNQCLLPDPLSVLLLDLHSLFSGPTLILHVFGLLYSLVMYLCLSLLLFLLPMLLLGQFGLFATPPLHLLLDDNIVLIISGSLKLVHQGLGPALVSEAGSRDEDRGGSEVGGYGKRNK